MEIVPEGSAVRGRGMRWVMIAIAALVLTADQVSKSIVLATHPGAGTGWIAVQLVRNTGASDGIASGYPVLVTLAALVIVGGAVVFAIRVRSKAVAVCLAAVCGGALGNLSDRIFRAPGFGRGAVVDWIHIAGRGGSFNVADTAIQFGAIAAVVAMFLADRAAKTRKRELAS